MNLAVSLLMENPTMVVGAALAFVTVAPYIWHEKRKSLRVVNEIVEAEKMGLREPVTIHPKVDHDICIGCSNCINACPEHDVLGLVDGKSTPVYASRCVGHGACERSCPVGAIQLVFGSDKRGVEIPQVYPNFETNVKRLFIAGELGGMGLVRNAALQGQEAVEYINEGLKHESFPEDKDVHDIVIVGSGPSGLSATLQAKKKNLRYITLDQEDEVGGAILSFPRAKVVMTSPVTLPIYGKLKVREVSKEKLLELWQDIVSTTGIKVDTGEKVLSAEKQNDRFVIKTSKRTLQSRYLLLCIGRRGTPRKLGVEGEKQAKVMYRLLEPDHYEGENILVVGGGDSAVEAAMALASQKGTTVSLSYRRDAFARIKTGNRSRLDEMTDSGQLKLIMESQVEKIGNDSVTITQSGKTFDLPNDSVFVFAGGESPNGFLKNVGVTVETKYGTR